ncbi:effector-associated constant component EACC1 [Streptomyces xanthophaeus]
MGGQQPVRTGRLLSALLRILPAHEVRRGGRLVTVYRLTAEESGHSDQQSLRQLAEWLRGDEVVADQAEIELTRAPLGRGDMGAAFETVQVVVDSGFQLASLVVAIAAWRRTRPVQGGVTIERNEVRVTIDTDDPEKVRKIVQALEDPS